MVSKFAFKIQLVRYTMGIWALNAVLFGAAVTGAGKTTKAAAPPPPVKAAVAKVGYASQKL
jgi:hypothetical protein